MFFMYMNLFLIFLLFFILHLKMCKVHLYFFIIRCLFNHLKIRLLFILLDFFLSCFYLKLLGFRVCVQELVSSFVHTQWTFITKSFVIFGRKLTRKQNLIVLSCHTFIWGTLSVFYWRTLFNQDSLAFCKYNLARNLF